MSTRQTDPALGPTGKTYVEADFRAFCPAPDYSSSKQAAMPQAIPNFKIGDEDSLRWFLERLITYPDLPSFHGRVVPPTGHNDFGMATTVRAVLYPHTMQGGGYDGSGTILIQQYGYRSGKSLGPMLGSFAICKHQNKYKPTANPSRGFHDMWCTLCGLDTSYDSSD